MISTIPLDQSDTEQCAATLRGCSNLSKFMMLNRLCKGE